MVIEQNWSTGLIARSGDYYWKRPRARTTPKHKTTLKPRIEY